MIGIIYNPIAAGGNFRGRMRDLLVLMDSLQIKYDYRESKKAGDTMDLALELAETCSTVLAVGGDGTVFETITALKDRDVRLAILPYGSGNDAFASVYGEDCTDAELLEHIMSETDIRVDCIRVNDQYNCFILASYGFAADLVKAVKEKGGSYMSQAFRILFKVNKKDYTIQVNGREMDVRSEYVSVINTGIAGGGMKVCKDSVMIDGEFELTILHECGLIRRFLNFIALARGRLDRQPNLELIRAKECTIIAKDGNCIDMDGELLDIDRAEIKMVEGGLRFAYRK